MRIRSLVLSSLAVAAWCLSSTAHADVPGPGTGGSGGSDAGLGTGGSADPGCNISAEEQSGTTCVACDTSVGLCSEQLGDGYNYVCKSSSSTEIWCNGPARNQASDNDVASCAVKVPGAAYGDLLGVGLVAAAALAVGSRRRRR